MAKLSKFRKLITAITIVAAAISLSAISYYRVFDAYELEMLDLRFLIRGKIPNTDKVVMIEIGDDSIKKLGRFPFERSYHAVLVKALTDFGAKAILFDLFFSEPEPNDPDFINAIKDAGNVYLPVIFDIKMDKKMKVPYADTYLGKNTDELTMFTKGTGQINIFPDMDGKFRRIPPYIRHNGKFYPYMSFLAACDYLGIKEKDINLMPGEYIDCAKRIRIPLDDDSNMIINYAGGWGTTYKHVSYVDVLQSYFTYVSGQKPFLDPSVFKDKICIVGLTGTGTVDIHPNPFETLCPGMGIHAEIINSMFNNRFLGRVPRAGNLYILFLLAIIIATATVLLRPIQSLAVLLAENLLLFVIGVALFNTYGIWIDLFCPIAIMVCLYLSITLYRYIVEWKRRVASEHELDIAKRIQESFLPKKLPATEGLEVAAAMFTARQVGGDLYDFLEFDNGRLGVLIGDVSGKGVPASLFMAMVTGAFKFFAGPLNAPCDVLKNLNDKLVKESSSNLFVTVFYSVFDMKEKTFAYANGGHLPVIHLSEGKDPELLDTAEGTPLGLMEGNFSGGKRSFVSGDVFLFYTDGITEAMNRKGDMYEKERLLKIAGLSKYFCAEDIVKAIEKDVRHFEPKRLQHDDMTIIAVKVK